MEKSLGFYFHLKKSKAQNDQELTVYMRITVNGTYCEASTKRKCSLLNWNTASGRATGKTDDAKSLNSYLEVLQRKGYEIRKQLLDSDKQVTAENIKTLLQGGEISEHKHMLMEVFQNHNDQMAALVGREYAPGTLERYQTSFRHTRSFLQWKYKVSDITLTRGMATGAMKKVIGTANQYLYNVSYFDIRSRVVQTQSTNYTGGTDTATVQYDFIGNTLRSFVQHQKNGNTAQGHRVVTKMDYDQGIRLKHIWKNIDGAASDQLIDSMKYNELGQLRAKYLGNNIDSLVYDYNIRGWLTGINKNYVAGTANNYFGMELGYDKSSSAAPGNTYAAQEYNGNIEGTVWKTAGSGTNRKYDYSYDNANRLTAANFNQYNGSGFDKSAGVDFSVSNLSYDANGNILTMEQKGFIVGGSNFIDQLKYTYQTNSNKLSQVYDTADNPTSQLGDFHYNSGTKQSTDYTYDGNGNLITDNNKAIDNIAYNYLSLQQSVHMNGKGNILYTYDASGARLKKVVMDSTNRHSVTTLYVTGFVYQQTDTITTPGGGNDTLQFIMHEEGRARWAYHKYTTGATAYKLEYDFFERDNQGNTRMVLTQERDTSNYLASMEAAYRSTESQLFANIASTSYAWSSVPGSSGIPSGTKLAITNPNDSVSKVDFNGTTGQKTGPSLLLKVMSGDTVNMAVQSYYNTNSDTVKNSSFTDVLNSLAAGLVNTATGNAEGTLSGFTSSSGPVYAAVSSFLPSKDPAPPTGYPKAYLNWILLDDQFNYVSSSSGSVLAASSTYPAATLNTVAPGAPLTIPKNGYLYVWVSNETQGWDVFFDNLSVQYKQGPVLEENHYYPFGLAMAGLSDKAIKTKYAENKYRYDQGTELQNKEFSDGSGLEMYETQYRGLDPQLGRFAQIDPIADKSHSFSTYQYTENNPVIANDPTGLKKKLDPRTTFNIQPNDNITDMMNSSNSGDYDVTGGLANYLMAGGGDPSTFYNAQMYAEITPHANQLFPEFPYIGPGYKGSSTSTNSMGQQVLRIQSGSTIEDGSDNFPYQTLNTNVQTVRTVILNNYSTNGAPSFLSWLMPTGTSFGFGGNDGSGSAPLLKFVGFRKGFIPEFESSLLDDKGAITPGPFIIYPTDGSENPYYYDHEPGHVLQFYLLGPINYVMFVAIPSLFSASTMTQEAHANTPWEKSATTLWYWFSGDSDPSNPHY